MHVSGYLISYYLEQCQAKHVKREDQETIQQTIVASHPILAHEKTSHTTTTPQ
jgi:hypothetical protein